MLCCRRRDADIQRWKGLANQARADGQALQAKRDEEAALYSERVQHKPYPATLPPGLSHCMFCMAVAD